MRNRKTKTVKNLYEISQYYEIILIFAIVLDILIIKNGIKTRGTMQISYDKLWKLLIDKKMSKTELKDLAGISFNIIAKLGKCEAVSMESMYKICTALDCNIGDIVEFLKPGVI